MKKSDSFRRNLDIFLLLLILPLIGVSLAGKPILQYLHFPPMTKYVEHAAAENSSHWLYLCWPA